MNPILRLALLVPAILIAVPASAQTVKKGNDTVHYVTLSRMLKTFAAEARAKQASRAVEKPAVVVATR